MDFENYIKERGRGLPVFLLLDTSGSMQGQKIDTVNVALKEMINTFRKIENPKGIVELCLITFGNEKTTVIKPLSEINSNDNYMLRADGDTPLGQALDLVSEMIEDYNIVSKRSYTPTIVLISDGNPTDYDALGKNMDEIKNWDKMVKVHTGTRTSKAVRLAMGIGGDMNVELLKAFVNNPGIPIINAMDNNTISKFFQWVTMSVSTRSISNNPNDVEIVDPNEIFDNDEVEF